ncbi:MAG: serine hydrolase domain-containing protein [Actinomycetota bacterium]|nr:serine hydrolase domain-containing protein [Actinomycetota bacterium]
MRLRKSMWPQGTGVVVLLLLLLVSLPCGHPVLAQQENPQEPALRNTEPLEAVVADLESYIPEQMDESGVPGLAVALIRGGQVAWTAGFGIANRITGTPVTHETAFEVASNSKVVTAYAALRLVDQRRLQLDAPLAASLETRWLPTSGYAGEVTLRHLASHSSGLPDNDLLPVNKSIAFQPGSAFAYSGVGFLYLQEAVEQVTGSSLEEAAQALVFEPLGMESSSFAGRFDVEPPMASGHMPYIIPTLLFLFPFGGILLLLVLIGILVRRLRVGTWHLPRMLMVGNAVVAILMTLVLVYMTLGRVVPNLALLVVLSALVFAVVLALVTFVGRQTIARLAEPRQRRRLLILWMIVSAVALVLLAGRTSGPIPSVLSPTPSAIGSLRTTAPDLAVFLAEVAAPRLLSQETADQIRTPQIAITDDFSWGLGIGIQHSDQGDALWQNGITPGFRSVMVIYPEHQWGVVVLTNSDDGLQVAYDVAARALGGKGHWSSF